MLNLLELEFRLKIPLNLHFLTTTQCKTQMSITKKKKPTAIIPISSPKLMKLLVVESLLINGFVIVISIFYKI
jgi:hypothetical protein